MMDLDAVHASLIADRLRVVMDAGRLHIDWKGLVKNQYFGDVSDYRKYGLLRALLGSSELRLAVGWYLTSDDGGADGGFRQYLQEPARWRHYDPSLFDHLSNTLDSCSSPTVALIEQTDVLPRATFFSEIVPDPREDRRAWGHRLVQVCAGEDLVFVDPDNGIEVPSKPIGRHGSSKYVSWDEVTRLWEADSSLLIYQHFRRERRTLFISRMMGELRRKTHAHHIEAFTTPHVLFLLASQTRHWEAFREAVSCHLPQWGGQIEIAGVSVT